MQISHAEQQLEAHLEFWQQKLSAEWPLLQVPADRLRLAKQTFTEAHYTVQLDGELVLQLRAWAEQAGTTLAMMMLTAYQILLLRYSGQEDLLIGTPVRVGSSANLILYRTDLSGEPAFRDLLTRVRQVVTEAEPHQEFPFAGLLEWLSLPSGASGLPVVQALFAHQHVTGRDDAPSSFPHQQVQHELALEAREATDGLQLVFHYNADLFERATLERIGTHIQVLLRSCIDTPECPVGELTILTAAERMQMLVNWNETTVAYPQDLCMHEAFEAQAKRTPDALAVDYEGQTLTYRELDERANQLAHYLRKQGVGPEQFVGICVERSLEMMIGIFGILKAGGAYVPMDPHYPHDRLAYMMEDAGIKLLLTQAHLQANLPPGAQQVIALDAKWPEIGLEQTTRVESGVQLHNLAYVIYTSGSTGRPKGVMIEHRGVYNLASYMKRQLKAGPGTRMLQFASFSFDASVCEFTIALHNGGALFLANKLRLMPGPDLVKYVQEKRITHAMFTPTVLSILNPDDFTALHTIMCGAEACTPDLVQKWSGGRTFTNAYGPTEITVIATMAFVNDPSRLPPIGGPLDNTQLYVLDRYMQPVPIGVTGELYIGSVGLARGYLNRPELTAERFVENPFCAGTRLYKTGDLVRWLPDGQLEYSGRIDNQVKIRGFRIEVGEVEAAVMAADGVKKAVVLCEEEQPGNKRLVAYVVLEEGGDLQAVREQLYARLPDFMVPSAFVVVEQIPYTQNDKVDTRALQAIGRQAQHTSSIETAPRTPTEQTVAQLFAEALGAEQVDVHSDFFRIGGQSLLAIQVAMRVRKAFGIEIGSAQLFEHRTVAQLAAWIEQQEKEGKYEATSNDEGIGEDLQRAKSRRALLAKMLQQKTGLLNAAPVSVAQNQLWFFEQLVPVSPLYNVPCAFRISGPLDVAALRQALQEVIDRHQVLRCWFTEVEGQLLQVNSPLLEEIELPVIDLRDLAPVERETQIERMRTVHASEPFLPAKGQLWRAALLRVEEAQHLVLLSVHHIAFDGWSLGVFLREWLTLYTAFARGKSSPLPELPLQYADYALWQQQRLQSGELEPHLQYWREQLADIGGALELPADHPRPLVKSYKGDVFRRQLPTRLLQQLQELAQRENATLFMVLLAAWKMLLFQQTGAADLIVGTPSAGRTRQELLPLVGFFANILTLRTRLHDKLSYRELLAQVRETAVQAYAHQEIPFDQLVKELQPERNLSYNPLFQLTFGLEGDPLQHLQVPGLQVSPLELLSTGTAKFDIDWRIIYSGEQVVLHIEYSNDLFEKPRIEQMAEQYLHLLAGIVANPDCNIAEQPPVADVQMAKIVQFLQEIWAAEFNGQTIGLQDDFFKIGGHSLLAMKMLSKMRDRFGDVISIQDFFAEPTIAALAGKINERLTSFDLPIKQAPAGELSLEQMLQEIDAFSEEEIATLLAEMETEEEGN